MFCTMAALCRDNPNAAKLTPRALKQLEALKHFESLKQEEEQKQEKKQVKGGLSLHLSRVGPYLFLADKSN